MSFKRGDNKKYVKYILAPSVAINTAKSAKAEYKKQMIEREKKRGVSNDQ